MNSNIALTWNCSRYLYMKSYANNPYQRGFNAKDVLINYGFWPMEHKAHYQYLET